MTHRTPVLSVMQRDYLSRVAQRLTCDQRSIFFAAITSRLSGSPSDQTVQRVAMLVRAELERPGEILRRA
jgi:hypothetical protein